jgi:arsenate reductase
LNDFKEEVEVVNYLNQPLLKDDIEQLLELLQVEPQDIIRRNEAVFKEHFADKQLSRSEWIEAIVKYPILLEK